MSSHLLAAATRVLAALVCLGATACVDTMPADLRALLARYECPVADGLRRAHDGGDPAGILDHAIFISMPDGPTAQCLFLDHQRLLYCEVSPQPHASPEHQPSAATTAALTALGFSADPRGYSDLRRAADATPDYTALAALMLKALYAGYGARAAMPLTIRATSEPPAGAMVCGAAG